MVPATPLIESPLSDSREVHTMSLSRSQVKMTQHMLGEEGRGGEEGRRGEGGEGRRGEGRGEGEEGRGEGRAHTGMMQGLVKPYSDMLPVLH